VDKKFNKRLTHRLKIIAGQIKGLQDMIEQGKYCIDVITQVSATREALSSMEDFILENHLSTCTVRQMKGREQNKAVKEILKVYKLSKKK